MKTAQWLPKQTASTKATWQLKLREIVASSAPKDIAVVGIGHPLRSDDYVGSYIAKLLIKRTLRNGVHIFDAEANVEAVITKVTDIGPEHVLFIDACDMGANPGESNLVPVAETSYPFFTTHGIPLKVLAEQLLSKSEVLVLAIQPASTEFGDEMSPEIRDVADSISEFLTMILTGEAS